VDLLPVHTPEGFWPGALLEPLAAALAGEGPAVMPYADPALDVALLSGLAAAEPAEGIAAVISTSGSTGLPKQTMLSAGALAASAEGTAMVLRGEGQWLLTLPVHYVAGLQVLARSLFAGTRPVAMDPAQRFTAEAFTAAAAQLTDPFRITSLVPTQLHRLLADPAPETIKVLRRFDAILVGGARTSDRLREESRKYGLKVVRTYGMSETCGGCVYDGVPLPGAQVRLEDGRVWIGGQVLASGYLGRPDLTAEHFPEREGRRWYRTGDVGEVDDAGTLTVLGRADDVINTGGVKISANIVAQAIEAVPGVEAAVVAGVEHPEWGTQVAAAVVGPADAGVIRSTVRERLGAAAVPKIVLPLDELPALPTGKPDRLRIQALLAGQAGLDQHSNGYAS
jgi:o-succinylbenzoate---CoA ligase